jgi:3',5'-cyclic AMP phosphodiesterase CpdA
MFRLAHLSDVHLGPVPMPSLREFASKRLVGYANWRRNRAGAFTPETLDRLVDDIRAQEPDHIAVTGDLTNIALREEFENARRWLEALGPPDEVTAIPGNHDAYVPKAHLRYRTLWAPWMAGDSADAEFVGHALFPFMRRKRHLALIGVSSARASAPFMATGRVGRRQTERLRALLKEARMEGLFRVILIHHPPKMLDPRNSWRRLTDGRRLRAAIEADGAELVLHGHDHVRSTSEIPGPHGPVPVVGVPAGSGPPISGRRGGGYALHEIDERAGHFRLTIIHRGYDEEGRIVETVRTQYRISRPSPRPAGRAPSPR